MGEPQPALPKSSPLEDLASCQLRGLPVPLPLQPDFPDLLPRGHVGGCGSAKRPSSPASATQCFAICRCFHHPFRPAVDIFKQANRLRAIHS
ncbi:GD13572 [Drosophila simulans]|uniref:GD13572 n=1 Tax=Drosophila simulans TaxID=7240 RepID=B4QLF3_DROSI|nr:GD13572 [Drosophila simulans]